MVNWDALACVAPLAALLSMAAPAPALAQQPSLASVLARATAYVAEFQRQLSGIVAEEQYVQDARASSSPISRNRYEVNRDEVSHRELKSDFLLVRPAGTDRFVEFRDVFEVDGTAVRDRQERLTGLFLDPSATAAQQMHQILIESARYNIGDVWRTVNTPTLPLLFLHPDYQRRFAFTRAPNTAPVLERKRQQQTDQDLQHLIASGEVWVIEYEEVERSTLIRTTGNRDLPARGRFWIEPITGRVRVSELIARDSDVRATIDVYYESALRVDLLVPVQMRERYESRVDGSHVEGTATYSRFRQFQVLVDQDLAPSRD